MRKMKGEFIVVRYEYKVIDVDSFASTSGHRHLMNGWAPSSEIEEKINKLANEGWEYLNPIVFPYTTNGEFLCHTLVRLVFRREKF